MMYATAILTAQRICPEGIETSCNVVMKPEPRKTIGAFLSDEEFVKFIFDDVVLKIRTKDLLRAIRVCRFGD